MCGHFTTMLTLEHSAEDGTIAMIRAVLELRKKIDLDSINEQWAEIGKERAEREENWMFS